MKLLATPTWPMHAIPPFPIYGVYRRDRFRIEVRQVKSEEDPSPLDYIHASARVTEKGNISIVTRSPEGARALAQYLDVQAVHPWVIGSTKRFILLKADRVVFPFEASDEYLAILAKVKA